MRPSSAVPAMRPQSFAHPLGDNPSSDHPVHEQVADSSNPLTRSSSVIPETGSNKSNPKLSKAVRRRVISGSSGVHKASTSGPIKGSASASASHALKRITRGAAMMAMSATGRTASAEASKSPVTNATRGSKRKRTSKAPV